MSFHHCSKIWYFQLCSFHKTDQTQAFIYWDLICHQLLSCLTLFCGWHQLRPNSQFFHYISTVCIRSTSIWEDLPFPRVNHKQNCTRILPLPPLPNHNLLTSNVIMQLKLALETDCQGPCCYCYCNVYFENHRSTEISLVSERPKWQYDGYNRFWPCGLIQT